MSLVADIHPFVVGVDTPARHHVYTILSPTGVLIYTRDFPTSPAGINRALVWVARRTQAHADTCG